MIVKYKDQIINFDNVFECSKNDKNKMIIFYSSSITQANFIFESVKQCSEVFDTIFRSRAQKSSFVDCDNVIKNIGK